MSSTRFDLTCGRCDGPVKQDARYDVGVGCPKCDQFKRYRTIVADPPWHYERTGITFAAPTGGDFTGTGLPYGTMTVDEIAALPVADWAEDNAALFVWTTHRYVWQTPAIVKAWGFEPVKLLTWAKPPTGFSVGGTFGNSTEFVLYGRRGRAVATERTNRDWWDWPRRGGHSAKPEAFLDVVEQTHPGPYLEMFARRARFGWDYWGDESLGTAEVAA